MNWVENAISIHATTVRVGARRAELLATNLANADTPGYRARDINFGDVMADVQMGINREITRTRPGHMGGGFNTSSHVFERQDVNVKEDGNTVSKEREQAAFTENSIRYMAGVRFLNSSVQGMLKALKGE